MSRARFKSMDSQEGELHGAKIERRKQFCEYKLASEQVKRTTIIGTGCPTK